MARPVLHEGPGSLFHGGSRGQYVVEEDYAGRDGNVAGDGEGAADIPTALPGILALRLGLRIPGSYQEVADFGGGEGASPKLAQERSRHDLRLVESAHGFPLRMERHGDEHPRFRAALLQSAGEISYDQASHDIRGAEIVPVFQGMDDVPDLGDVEFRCGREGHLIVWGESVCKAPGQK